MAKENNKPDDGKKQLSKPAGTILLILICIVGLGLLTTWFLFSLFPNDIKLEIQKQGLKASILGASGLFLTTVYLYTSLYMKLLKALAPMLFLTVVYKTYIEKDEYIPDNIFSGQPEILFNNEGRIVTSSDNNSLNDYLRAHRACIHVDNKEQFDMCFQFDFDAEGTPTASLYDPQKVPGHIID